MAEHSWPPKLRPVSPSALALLSWLVIRVNRLFISCSWSCACRCLASACSLDRRRSSSLARSLANRLWSLEFSNSISCIWLASAFSSARWDSERERTGKNQRTNPQESIIISDSLCLILVCWYLHIICRKDFVTASEVWWFNEFVIILMLDTK